MTDAPWFVRVKFAYNKQLVDWMRALPGAERSFDKATKTWRCPQECVTLVQKEAAKYGVKVSWGLDYDTYVDY